MLGARGVDSAFLAFFLSVLSVYTVSGENSTPTIFPTRYACRVPSGHVVVEGRLYGLSAGLRFSAMGQSAFNSAGKEKKTTQYPASIFRYRAVLYPLVRLKDATLTLFPSFFPCPTGV